VINAENKTPTGTEVSTSPPSKSRTIPTRSLLPRYRLKRRLCRVSAWFRSILLLAALRCELGLHRRSWLIGGGNVGWGVVELCGWHTVIGGCTQPAWVVLRPQPFMEVQNNKPRSFIPPNSHDTCNVNQTTLGLWWAKRVRIAINYFLRQSQLNLLQPKITLCIYFLRSSHTSCRIRHALRKSCL